jgi:hypothetical protein
MGKVVALKRGPRFSDHDDVITNNHQSLVGIVDYDGI